MKYYIFSALMIINFLCNADDSKNNNGYKNTENIFCEGMLRNVSYNFEKPISVKIIESQSDQSHVKDREEKIDIFNDAYLDTQIISAESANIQKWISIVQSFLGVISAILILLTYRETIKTSRASIQTAIAAEKSAQVAENSLNLSERAWLGLDRIELLGSVDAEDKPDITYVVKNFGRAPALNVRQVFEWKVESLDCINTFLNHNIPEHSEVTTIFPNATANFHPLVNMPTLTQEQSDAIKSGTKTIVILAKFEYLDSFNRVHLTQERIYYKVHRNTFGPTKDGNYAN